MNKRVDTFIGAEVSSDYYLQQNGLSKYINKATFRFSGTKGYLVLSKASPLSKSLLEFNQVMDLMIKDGRIDHIINRVIEGRKLKKFKIQENKF